MKPSVALNLMAALASGAVATAQSEAPQRQAMGFTSRPGSRLQPDTRCRRNRARKPLLLK